MAWLSKRWMWAALAGATVTIGMATGRADSPPKVGAVISLNIDGKGERQFRVMKSERQPDGTFLSELKDTKSGETITLVDKPGDPVPLPPIMPETPKDPAPKGKAPAAGAMPDAPKEKEKEKRPILGRIFGDRDKPTGPSGASAMPAFPGETPGADASKAQAAPDSGKKQGLLGRVFGPKKPTGPSMPAAMPGPVVKPSPSAPPAVIPTPPGGVTGGTAPPGLPAFPMTGGPSAPSGATEPPRVMPMRPTPAPVAPPMPVKPAPVSPPTAPAFPAPTPLPTPMPPSVPAPPTPMPSAPAPSFPAPSVPAPLPAPPAVPPVSVPLPAPSVPAAPGGLQPIPIPTGGTSATKPIQVVVPVGFVPAGVAFDREVQPFVVALQTMAAPSARLTAAKGLADGRHASSEGVKAVLFQAAQMDPCGEVRAACIDHLCKLGYFNAQFLGYVQTACEDSNPMVRDSAKAACTKMVRK